MLGHEGQGILLKFMEAADANRHLIKEGNIKGMSDAFRNLGAVGMKNLAGRSCLTRTFTFILILLFKNILHCQFNLTASTDNTCLKETFRRLGDLDEQIAEQLQSITSPHDAEVLICDVLEHKARQTDWCRN